MISPRDPQYRAWQQFLAETHGAEHRYNSKDQSPAANLKYFVSMYDKGGAMMVRTVKDHSSALVSGRGTGSKQRGSPLLCALWGLVIKLLPVADGEDLSRKTASTLLPA